MESFEPGYRGNRRRERCKHGHGHLKGRAAKWYWACSVCGLGYITQGSANVCCAGHKDRPWLKAGMKPSLNAIGRIVDDEFIRFK